MAFMAALTGIAGSFAPAVAQVPAAAPAPHIQTGIEALAQDAAEYARQNGVALDEAMRRLRAQEESVAATDRIQETYRDRLAGISIEHHPAYRIVVLLTGSEPVADQQVFAGGMNVPIQFRTGAAATREQVIAMIKLHQAEIRAALPHPPGLGMDPRTGELVVTMRGTDADSYGPGELESRLAALTGVPVRIRSLERDLNLAVEGGARVVGISAEDGRFYACTTGFVVTKGASIGVATAAHCPDKLTYTAPGQSEVPLDFVGQWGWSYRDVQIHVAAQPFKPLFYSDTSKSRARPVTSWRNRASTRAGDVVCHRGERTGYSCSQVELIDYAPPGDLCGGPCEPSWVTVAGPICKSGDSGAPVFNGTIAFGLVKGGSYRRDGSCSFYFYMSTDFLPDGWSLLYQ
jgi:hypothetical protein